ncbi:MAG: STAS/SEC14 domain-containing protein [Syntrophobacteraceae bacterium]
MYQQLSGSSGKLLGFKISDGVTGEEVRQIGAIMAEEIAASGKIRLLVEIEGFRHMEPEALLEKLKFAREHAKDIERIAVLSDRVWIKSWVKVGGLLTHNEVEHFDRSEIEAAWKWLER